MPRGERPLEPGGDLVVEFARDLRLLREKAGKPTYRQLSARAHYSAAALSVAASGHKLPSLPVTLAYVAACDGDTAEWEARWRTTAAELFTTKVDAPDGEDDTTQAPYVGLAAFQQEDADRFFGRDKLATDLLTRLRQRRFLAVFGASGCGKSSLLRAGVAARLTAQQQDDSEVVVFTPGHHPIEECAVSLTRILGESPGTLRDEISTDPRNLHLRIRQAVAANSESDVVLVVDQFEELFTLCTDEQERTAFVDALVTATTDPTSRTRVILGVRADFLGHCGQHPPLVSALRDAQVLVGSMTTDELRLAITGPAEQAGYRVETALVARLVADVSQQSGMLPLVSHALLQTWNRRQGKVMTLAGYEAVGGIEHALARTAEQIHQAMDTDHQDLAQQIFLRLTALGEGTEDTKRRIRRDELGNGNPNTAQVLDTLIRARLVTVGHDSVEIAHEALIRHWPRLRDWLNDDRDGRRIHRQLTDATTEWELHERDEGLLYREAKLALWQDRPLDRLNDTERAFLATSRRALERERTARVRRLRLSLTALSVIVVVISLLAGLAVVQTSRIAEERDIANSRQLATSARSQLPIDPELALLLAIKAVQVKPTTEADAVLHQAVVDSQVRATVRTGDDDVEEVVVSPDGHQIVTWGHQSRLRVWKQEAPAGTWSASRVLSTTDNYAERPVFSADGRYLAARAPLGTIQVWDMSHAGESVTLRDQISGVQDLVFTSDGRQLIAARQDGLWSIDPTSRRAPILLRPYDGLLTAQDCSLSLSPDGRHVACSGPNGTWIEDLTGQHRPVKLLNEKEWGSRPAFSPVDGRVARGNQDGTVQVWDITDGHEVAALRVHEKYIRSVEFSPDGHSLVSAGVDGTVRITNSNSDANAMILLGHQAPVWAATFSPDGRWIASGGQDGTLRIWSATPGEAITLRGHTGPVRTATFTPDAAHLVSGGHDGTVRIWNRDSNNSTVLYQHSAEVTAVDVSPDGRLIASISQNGDLRIWDRSTHATKLDTKKSDIARPDIDGYTDVEFTSDGHIITCTHNGDIYVWNTGESITQHPVNALKRAPFEEISLSPDRSQIAIVDDVGGVRLQPLNRSDEGVELASSRSPVVALAFSPEGRRLATGERDGTVKIWPIDGNGEPVVLHGHQNELTSIAYSPDAQHIATSGNDGTVNIWDTHSDYSEPVVYRGYQASVEFVTFSPDGRHLLTTHDDGTIRIQQCDTCGTIQQTLELAKSHTTRQLTTDENKTFGLIQHYVAE